MTEDEARKRWCPFARVMGEGGEGGGNRWDGGTAEKIGAALPLGSLCIGSACMAWRWRWTPEKIADAAEGSLLATREPDGFCGLSGAPS